MSKQLFIRWIAGIWILFGYSFCYAEPAKISAIRIFATNDATRIIFNGSIALQSQIFALENPNRLVFDFANTKLQIDINTLRQVTPNIQRIRTGHPIPSTLRIVIDLNEPVTFKKLTQLDSKQIVIDVYPKKTNSSGSASVPKLMKVTKATTSVSEQAIALPVKKRPFIVVVDAGHGGKDTGAIGAYHTREKDVVLAIALQLAELINQQPNMRAVLTRKGDYFVKLGDRLVLARKGEADLFVAIHADSYFNSRASGASVFALSSRGATTVAAKWLSDVDNHSELGDVELNNLSDKSHVLRSVLIDLAQTATIRDSLRFGNSLLDSLENITKLHSPRVEQAPFMVLKSPDIPSILVETGFISNRTEEMRLQDKSYQHKMALAMFNGIRLYQKKYASEGV